MATIGLKIAQDPDTAGSLSLADTLAKATFGDPEGQMKARALASEVGVRMASRDKLLADTGLVNIKTKQEQALADAQDAAAANGPTAANAAANANALPVEAPRPSLDGGGYGPQPGIVDPNVVKMRDAIIAQNNAEWPVIVRSSNGVQLVEAGSKLAGAAALEGGLVPGARVDPNVQRVAGGLYTGSAPTTSTVWSPGDTAGVDAAARQKIEEEAAPKPFQPKDVTYRGQPGIVRLDASGNPVYTGAAGTETTPEKPDVHDYRGQPGVVTLDANGNPMFKPAQGTAPTTEKPNIVNVKDKPYVITTTPDGRTIGTAVDGISAPVELKQQGDGYVAIDTATNTATPVTGAAPQPKIINVGKNETPTTRQPDGSLKTVPTDIPPPPPEPTYQGKTAKDDALNRIVAVQQKLANKQPITPQEAALYETDYNLAYGATHEKIIDPATGKTIDNMVTPSIPANTPSVNDVRGAAGQPLLPPPPPEPKQGAKAPSQEQAQLQQYTPQLVTSTDKLDKITPAQVPSVFMQQILGVRGNDPSFVQSVLASTNFVNPQQRAFAQSVAEYNQSLLYMLSGKAITSDEYKRAMTSYIPQPNDDANLLAAKADARHSIIASAVRIGWGNDPDTGKIVKDNIKAKGIDLDKYDLTIPQPNDGGGGGDKPPAGAPPDARKAPDGNWYVPDPKRPGKYLQVQ